jgi:beta-glucoside operon transcriptional antiterminator
MKATKKINNNVAICVDNNNKELIAFGKGIGFPPMPYEIKDLSALTMTFYRIDKRFYDLIEDIPEQVLEVTALIVDEARKTLLSPLNPNLLIGLSDHINFAVIRLKKYKKMQMLFSYDVEQLYPKETALGRFAVQLIKRKLGMVLPESEITNIAMHLVNAKEEKEPETEGPDTEMVISEVAKMIEGYFQIEVDRNSFNYNRFAMHMRYYLKRIKEEAQFMNDNSAIFDAMKESNPEVYDCALIISDFIDKTLQAETTKDEFLYLMMHIYRITKNNNI